MECVCVWRKQPKMCGCNLARLVHWHAWMLAVEGWNGSEEPTATIHANACAAYASSVRAGTYAHGVRTGSYAWVCIVRAGSDARFLRANSDAVILRPTSDGCSCIDGWLPGCCVVRAGSRQNDGRACWRHGQLQHAKQHAQQHAQHYDACRFQRHTHHAGISFCLHTMICAHTCIYSKSNYTVWRFILMQPGMIGSIAYWMHRMLNGLNPSSDPLERVTKSSWHNTCLNSPTGHHTSQIWVYDYVYIWRNAQSTVQTCPTNSNPQTWIHTYWRVELTKRVGRKPPFHSISTNLNLRVAQDKMATTVVINNPIAHNKQYFTVSCFGRTPSPLLMRISSMISPPYLSPSLAFFFCLSTHMSWDGSCLRSQYLH